MSDHIVRTIADVEADIAQREDELLQLKRMVNVLCGKIGIAQKYDLAAAPTLAPAPSPPTRLQIGPDQFHGRPLNSAIAGYLRLRKAALPNSAPASAEEIHDALRQGGFTFEQRGRDEQLQGLRISLGKSSHTFRKLSNGLFGLVEWYEGESTGRRLVIRKSFVVRNQDLPGPLRDALSERGGDRPDSEQ